MTVLQVRDNLDLNNSDLIGCNVISRGKNKQLLQVRNFYDCIGGCDVTVL